MSKRPGFSFLVCPDPELTRRRLHALMDRAGGQYARQVFWGDAEDFAPGFWQALSSVSLFAKPQTVVLRRAEGLPAEFWEKLTRPLAGFNEHVWPVICLEGPFDPRRGPSLPKGLEDRPYWKVARKREWLWISPGLTPQTLAPLLKDWAAGRGLSFADGVERDLVALLPPDMTAAAAELEKLGLAAGPDRQIRHEHLQVLSFQAEMDTFAFVRAIAEARDPAGVWRKILDNELGGEEGFVFQFLALLLRDARTMWQLMAGEDEGLRLPAFARSGREALARRLGPQGLARLWDLAMQTESSIKSGMKTPEQALEMLVAELYALFGRVKAR